MKTDLSLPFRSNTYPFIWGFLLVSALLFNLGPPSLAGEDQARKENDFRAYDPRADARAAISAALKRARETDKHVLLQIGGNWCGWCKKLEKLYGDNEEVAGLLEKSYVLVHVNYSKENKNLELLKELGRPQRFGFPVLVVLDARGNRLHTQDSGFLERDGGHDPDKVARFLKTWSPAALDPENYD